MWAVPRVESQRSQGLFKPQVFRGERRRDRGREERGEEEGEEGEEGVIGRLRCDVSTFLASETAKQPPAGLPTSWGSQGRGWGCWSLLNRRLALWALTPTQPQRECPSSPLWASFSRLGLVPTPQG